MSSIALTPNALGTGTLTVAAPNTNTARTLTLPDATTTLVGTDATQTLSNKTIAASQLTGALPAIDGSALTGVGSLTLLGTLATTSGTSVTLSGLTLTSYKQLHFFFNAVSGTGSTSILRLNNNPIANITVNVPSTYSTGGGIIDLSSGVLFSSGTNYSAGGALNLIQSAGLSSGLTTASTSITFTVDTGSFDAGSILIYGVK